MASKYPQEFGLHVTFEARADGGLIARCDKLPNFYLSHSNAEAVCGDVIPALETILSDMYGVPMRVKRLPDVDEALNCQPPLATLICKDQSYVGRVEA